MRVIIFKMSFVRVNSIREGSSKLKKACRDALYNLPKPLDAMPLRERVDNLVVGRMPHVMIVATPGSGKTTILLCELPEWMHWRQAQNWSHKAVISVPEYSLAGQMERDCARHCPGLRVVTMYGRGWKIDGKHTCCREAALAGEIISRGGDPNDWPCNDCGCVYQEQKEAAEDADIVIVVSNFLFQWLSLKASKGVALWIIDERFTDKGLILPKIDEPDELEIPVEGFADRVANVPVLQNGMKDDVNTQRVIVGFRKLEQATKDAWKQELDLAARFGRAPLPAAVEAKFLHKAGMDLREVQSLLELNERRLVKVRKPQSVRDRQEVLKETSNDPVVLRHRHLLETVCAALGDKGRSGVVQVYQKKDGLVMCRIGRMEIREAVKCCPIIHLDATGSLPIVQYYSPRMELALHLEITAPHQRVYKVVDTLSGSAKQKANRDDSAWSMKCLDPRNARDDDERERRIRRLREIEEFCLARNAALITHKR
jgi:hypothetical protein